MARHISTADMRDRRIRLLTLALVWLAGLGAGFFALLGSLAHYGCGSNDSGLGCRTSGAALGWLIVVAVVAVVVTVTVVTLGRGPKQTLLVGAAGIVALALCLVAARALLATV